MRNKRVLVIFMLLVMSLISVSAFASSKVGTTGAQFLKVGVGARATAMGGVYTGVADDVSALYWNPGGLGGIKSTEVIYTYNKWFQDITHHFVGGAVPTEFGVFGLGVTMLGMDDLEKRSGDTPDPEGTFKAQDMAIAFAYGTSVTENLMVGGSLKMLSSKIDDESASGMAVDLGALMKTGVQGLNVGFAVTNLGGEYKFIDEGDPLPMTIKLGAGYKVLNDALTLAADVIYPNDNDIMFGGGVEYALKFGTGGALALRTGYKTGVDSGGMSGLGAGIGISYQMFGFDFAWAPYGDLGDAIRGSLSLKF
ncbi:MAG: PorV/PorQ family protein [bacterium]|nr:PorV/PorQ family protein [bacterium]MDD5354779.1 PorV/PorQ family protein [bacterium]